jgi:hypothetical protein
MQQTYKDFSLSYKTFLVLRYCCFCGLDFVWAKIAYKLFCIFLAAVFYSNSLSIL